MNDANKENKLVSFTYGDAQRIADTVRAYESERRPTKGSRLPRSISASASVRLCSFTGQWSISSEKTVTFRSDTAVTASAINLVCGLSPTGACDAVIAKDGTAWYLVQPNLTQQPGYSASGTQVLTITNGNLRWIGTTACT